MNTRHTRLRSILTGLMLSILTAQDPFVIDTSLSNSLPQSIANSIEIADVDNDGYNEDRCPLYGIKIVNPSRSVAIYYKCKHYKNDKTMGKKIVNRHIYMRHLR